MRKKMQINPRRIRLEMEAGIMAGEIKNQTERIHRLYEKLQNSTNYVDIDRARYFTESFKKTEGEPINVRFAKALLHTAQNIKTIIPEDQLILGQIGGPERYGILYPELDGLFFENLQEVLNDRDESSFKIKKEDAEYLQNVVYPYWKGKTYYEDFAQSLPDDILRLTYEPGNVKKARYLINETETQNSSTQWVLDYKIGIENGFEAIKKRAEKRIEELENSSVDDVPDREERLAYEEASRIVSEAVITFAKRYAEAAEKAAEKTADGTRKAELEELARILYKVPRYPAETFYEAVQSQFIIQMFSRLEQKTSGTISNGRMDQYLYPYYKADIEKGILDEKKADELLSSLWIAIAQFRDVYVSPAGSAFSNGYAHWEAVTIGGLTPDGLDATNELSYLILKNKRELPLDFPDLAARIHTNSPERFLNEIAETIKIGSGHPKLLNDEEIIPVNLAKGATFEEANDYSVSGCTETRLIGRETWTSKGPVVNLAALVELTLRNGKLKKYGDELLTIQTGDASEFQTWEDFYSAFKEQETYYVRKTIEQIGFVHKLHGRHFASPLGSVLHKLAIEEERDIHSDYINNGLDFGFFDFVGFATTVDSLLAIKKHVYEQKNVSLTELTHALDRNFEGYEVLRQRLIHSPKYGNNDEEADRLGREIDALAAEISNEEAKKIQENLIVDVRYVPASSNVPLGKVVSALPNGRLEGLPLSDGTSASQGADENGPTAVLLSNYRSKNFQNRNRAARLLNLKFTPASLEGKEGTRRLVQFIKSWRDLKLWHVQFNVIDQKTLIDAKAHPENYRNLIVRVAGYSAYFVNLSEDLQNDIIARTAHEEVYAS